MKNLIHRLKVWYEQLSLRERALFMLLTWALIYSLFSLILFRPIDSLRTGYFNQIIRAKSDLDSLKLQTEAIDKIASSPLYAEWQKQQAHYQKMQNQYKSLISNFSKNNWHEVIKSVMENHPNVTLAHIDNSDEKLFSPISMSDSGTSIYQQDVTLILYGDYFNTINYLKHIEQVLPNVHWDTLSYEVVSYPNAKITMEFSVFYDKETSETH